MLRGDEQYKRRYATRDDSVCTVAAAARPVGKAAVATIAFMANSTGGRGLLKRWAAE
jgi:hypothetical protein